MVADVPVGALLSGGLDSSLIVALMQAQGSGPVRTFTVGFDVPDYDEAPQARRIADHLGTDHTELRVTRRRPEAIVPAFLGLRRAVRGLVADPRCSLPIWLAVTSPWRSPVTGATGSSVSTTGLASSATGFTGPVPDAVRRHRRPRAVAAARAVGSPRAWNLPCHAPLGGAGPSGRQGPQVGPSMASATPDRTYRPSRSAGTPRWSSVLARRIEPRWTGRSASRNRNAHRPRSRHLPDDLLVKVDRLDGGRIGDPVPILDPVVYAEAWRLAPAGWPTARASVSCATSCTATSRPRSPRAPGRLRRSVRRLAAIRSASMGGGAARRGSPEAEEYLDVATVRRCWSEHLGRTRDHRHRLWAVLMFEAWLEAQR